MTEEFTENESDSVRKSVYKSTIGDRHNYKPAQELAEVCNGFGTFPIYFRHAADTRSDTLFAQLIGPQGGYFQYIV